MRAPAPDPAAVADAAARRRLLRRQAMRLTAAEPAAVLDLGTAVLFHRAVHQELAARLDWLDPVVLARLAEEQRRLAADLELLGELAAPEPPFEDAGPLAAALLARLIRHLDDDARVIERPLALGLASRQSPAVQGASNGARLPPRGEVR